MSFKTVAANANGAPVAPAPKKEEKKAEAQTKVTTGVALSALAEATVRSVFLGKDLEASRTEKAYAVENALQLKPTKNPSGPAQKLTVKLSPQESTLINDIFQNWALNQELTLLDVWGVDLFAHFEKLLPYFPEPASLLINEFTGKFILGYVGFLHQAGAKEDMEEIQNIPLYQRGMPASQHVVMMTQAEWKFCLEDLKKKIAQLELLPKAKITTIRKLLQNVKARLDLGCKFLDDKDAIVFLCDLMLRELQSHFPKSSALAAPCDLQKSLQDLTTYVRFIDTGFIAGREAGILSTIHPFFGQMKTHLEGFAKAQNKLARIGDLKRDLALLFKSIHEAQFDLAQCYSQAKANKLTHEQFCKSRGIAVRTQKSQEDFTTSLYFKFTQMQVYNLLVHDCLDIFDERIMVALYPQKFVPTYLGFRRLQINLDSFFQNNFLSVPNQPLPIPPSSSHAEALKTLANEMEKDLEFWTGAINPEIFVKALGFFSMLKETKRILYSEWVGLMEYCQPIVKAVEALIPTLDKVRVKHLGKIEEFLRKLPPQEVREGREKWIAYFKEVAFVQSLDFCRISMVSRDLDALSRFSTDLNALSSEEHLLSEPLVDFMELEGIEQLFSKLLTPHHPMGEDLEDKPARERQQKVESVVQAILAPAKRVEKVERAESKKNAQGPNAKANLEPRSSFALTDAPLAAPEVEEEAPVFSIARGEKTRKILARLRALGFLPVSQRGSHVKLEGKEGHTVIIPAGGKRKQQKRGTGRGISSQVNGMA